MAPRFFPEYSIKSGSPGSPVHTVNLKKPSMDDVFVFYTGRELRDEPAEKVTGSISNAGRRK